MIAPSRDTLAGRIYFDLRQKAKADGRDPAEYFVLYALEGFLRRLSRSAHIQDFVLKGGVLMAAYTARRPTRDIDLAASGFSNEVEEAVQRVQAIAAQEIDDGLVFDLSAVEGEIIRDEANYQGIRVHLAATLARAKTRFHIDINFGDPIWPAPSVVSFPCLLGGTLEMPGYPVCMVLAEKLVTAIERGIANTRWRDFVDIAILAQTVSVMDADLYAALEAVAHHRKTDLQPLAKVLAGMASIAQSRWAIWRRKQKLEARTPESFQDLIDQCAAFADPVLDRSSVRTWSPKKGCWIMLHQKPDIKRGRT